MFSLSTKKGPTPPCNTYLADFLSGVEPAAVGHTAPDSPSSVMRVRETRVLSKLSKRAGGKSISKTPVLTLTKAQGEQQFFCLFTFIAVTPEIPCRSPARVLPVPDTLLKMNFPLYSHAWTQIQTLLFWLANEGSVFKVIGYLWPTLFCLT